MKQDELVLDNDLRQPYSVEAEQAVLGSILVDPKTFTEVVNEIKADYFYIPQHREIFTVLSSMYELNQAIDFVSLLERLKREGVYDEAGGKAYLTQLVQTVPSAANVLSYTAIMRERYYARALMNVANNIIKDISENTADSGVLLDNAEQRIYEIRSGREVSGLTHIRDVLQNETYDRLSKMNDPETRDEFVGIPCGIGDLDRMLTGLNRSDLIILGARPGMGKTSFALNIARNVALDAKKTVCFFSLEMSRDQLAQRMLSSEAAIESAKLRTGKLEGDEWVRLTQAGETLSKAELYFDETSTITVPEMKAKCRRLGSDLGLIIIDYLQLMQTGKRSDSRQQEVSEISRSLKIMAKELNVPVLCLSQLSRAPEQRGEKDMRPRLSDLRDSGAIEQDADVVIFIYRDDYYTKEESASPGTTEFLIEKNRHGEVGTVRMYFDGSHTKFTSVDSIHGA